MTISTIVVGALRFTSFALLLAAILSWFPTRNGPFAKLNYGLDRITSPVLAPIRRIIRPISGLDISSLVAIVFVNAVLIPVAMRL